MYRTITLCVYEDGGRRVRHYCGDYGLEHIIETFTTQIC